VNCSQQLIARARAHVHNATFANTLTLAPSTLIFRLLLCKYVLHAFLSNKINVTYKKMTAVRKQQLKAKQKHLIICEYTSPAIHRHHQEMR